MGEQTDKQTDRPHTSGRVHTPIHTCVPLEYLNILTFLVNLLFLIFKGSGKAQKLIKYITVEA